MDNFIIYNIEECDISNEYLVNKLFTIINTNQPNECVFNLVTIEAVNQLVIDSIPV